MAMPINNHGGFDPALDVGNARTSAAHLRASVFRCLKQCFLHDPVRGRKVEVTSAASSP